MNNPPFGLGETGEILVCSARPAFSYAALLKALELINICLELQLIRPVRPHDAELHLRPTAGYHGAPFLLVCQPLFLLHSHCG